MDKKQEYRNRYINIRKSINNKDIKSALLVDQITSLDIFRSAKIIAIYYPLKDEIDVLPILSNNIYNKDIALPRIKDDHLEYYLYHLGDPLTKNKYHIYEPLDNIDNKIDINDIDIIIVPSLVASKNKYRLGYGKGYYDKTLTNYKGYKIGVCYKECYLEDIPHDDNDIKMDIIIYG